MDQQQMLIDQMKYAVQQFEQCIQLLSRQQLDVHDKIVVLQAARDQLGFLECSVTSCGKQLELYDCW